jgi:hypothetical protein
MEIVPPDRMPGENPLQGLVEYDAALDGLIANADRIVRIFDWRIGRNYNTPQRFELMRGFLLARRTNRIHMVLHHSTNVVRDCPRLILLLKQFSEGFSIHRTLPTARSVSDPFAIGDDLYYVHRFHHEDMRGVASRGDVANTRLLIKRFDEIRVASTPAVTATTIGL